MIDAPAELRLGTASARRGERAFGSLKVGEMNDGSPVEIPVAVLHGSNPGPVVWFQGGAHGTEYTGTGAIQRVIHGVDVNTMRGSVVALPMINILAYRGFSRGSTQDGMDLNRSYPGHTLETAMHLFAHTEILANILIAEMTRLANVVVDCHAGGIYATMSPYVNYYSGLGATSEYEDACRDLAIAAGLDVVWRSEAKFINEKMPGALRVAMSEHSIRAVTVEVGGQGRLDESEVAKYHTALLNILRYLRVIHGEPARPAHQLRVTRGQWLRANRGGLLWVKARVLDPVTKGQTIHVITDLLGRELERLVAPVDGYVIGIRTLGNVNSGEYCGSICELDS